MAVINWTLPVLLLAVLLLCSPVNASPNSDGDSLTYGNREENRFIYAVISGSVLIVSISIIGLCGWCFKRGFKPFDEHVLTDEQALSNTGSYIDIGDFSTLNVDALSAEAVTQVTIDPLPSVQIQDSKRSTAGSLSTVSGSLSHPQIPRTQLNYVAEIGAGWFGKVMTGEAMKLQAGLKKTKVIIKQLKDDATFEEKSQFLLEAQPYRELKHANILTMVGQCTDSMPYLIVLDFCAFGDLKGFLLRRKSEASVLSQSGLLIRIACDVSNGLEYMHRASMIHSDFAARSCLVAADMTVKIGDYGISQHRYKKDYYSTCHDIKIPIRWMAPETVDCQGDWVALRQPNLTKPANVWSFGVTLWEVLSFGRIPYDSFDDTAVLQKVFVDQDLKLQQPSLDIAFADRWYEIMQFCWLSSTQRPIMAELSALLKHLHQQTNALDQQGESFEDRWNSIRPKKLSNTISNGGVSSPPVQAQVESGFLAKQTTPNSVNNNDPSKVLVPNDTGPTGVPNLGPALNSGSTLNSTQVSEFPRTSTPAVSSSSGSRLSDNRTPSSALASTSSSMYYSANSTPIGNDSGSDVFMTPRTTSRSPAEEEKTPQASVSALSDLGTPVSPAPNDLGLSQSSAFNESSTMSIALSDSSQSQTVSQLEMAVLDRTPNKTPSDFQSKNPNQDNRDSQIEITADVHIDSNIHALLSDSFDLDDSIADNLTFSQSADDSLPQASTEVVTKEKVSTSVLESPKEKTVIMMQMPEEQNDLQASSVGHMESVIVESTHQVPRMQNATQMILEMSDEDNSSAGKSMNEKSSSMPGTNITAVNLGMGDSDVTMALMHADDDDGGASSHTKSVSQSEVLLRPASQGGRTFQIIDTATEQDSSVSTDTTPLVKTTEMESSTSRSESYDSSGEEEEEEKVTLTPSDSPTFDKQGGDYALESFTVEEKNETDSSVSVSDDETKQEPALQNHELNSTEVASDRSGDEMDL